MSCKTHWLLLPESIRVQALARYGRPQLALDLGAKPEGDLKPGPGDGFLYHWIVQEPAAGYCGPMPFGQLIRRTREV